MKVCYKHLKPFLECHYRVLYVDCEVFNEKAADIRQGCNQKCLDKKRILANQNKQWENWTAYNLVVRTAFDSFDFTSSPVIFL